VEGVLKKQPAIRPGRKKAPTKSLVIDTSIFSNMPISCLPAILKLPAQSSMDGAEAKSGRGIE
jgi:hypothetical protein